MWIEEMQLVNDPFFPAEPLPHTVQTVCDTDMLMPCMCLWSWTGRRTSELGWHQTRSQYLSFMSASRTDNSLYPCFNSFHKVWETTEKVNSKVIKTCIAYFIIMGGWEFFSQNIVPLGNACALWRKMPVADSNFSQIISKAYLKNSKNAQFQHF